MTTLTRSTISILMSQITEEESGDPSLNDPNQRLRDIIQEVDKTRDELRVVRENILGVSRPTAPPNIEVDEETSFEVLQGTGTTVGNGSVIPPLSCPYLQWVLPLHVYVMSTIPPAGTPPLDKDDAIARDHLCEYSRATTSEDIRRADRTAMERLKNDIFTNYNWHSAILLLHLTAKYLWESAFGVNFPNCSRKVDTTLEQCNENMKRGDTGRSYFTPQACSTPVGDETSQHFNFSPTRMGSPVSPVTIQQRIDNLTCRVNELERQESLSHGTHSPPSVPRTKSKFLARRAMPK